MHQTTTAPSRAVDRAYLVFRWGLAAVLGFLSAEHFLSGAGDPAGAGVHDLAAGIAEALAAAFLVLRGPVVARRVRGKVSDAKAIAALRDRWTTAVRDGDMDALSRLVTEDYEVWANGAPAFVGRAQVASTMGAAVAKYVVEQSFESAELSVAGTWAYERGVERISATPRDGGPTEVRAQRAFLVYRRDAMGEWRFARGMTNALPAER